MTTTAVAPLRPAAQTDTMLATAPDLMGTFRDAEAQQWAGSFTTDVVSWLRASGLDADDQAEFLRDLAAAIAGSPEEITEVIHAWRLTIRALSDPTRREILLGRNTDEDYLEATRPQ